MPLLHGGCRLRVWVGRCNVASKAFTELTQTVEISGPLMPIMEEWETHPETPFWTARVTTPRAPNRPVLLDRRHEENRPPSTFLDPPDPSRKALRTR